MFICKNNPMSAVNKLAVNYIHDPFGDDSIAEN